MTKKNILLIIFVTSCFSVFSQAGNGIYQFLDLPVSSRLAGLGGTNVSLRDNDLNFAFQNPALLTSETNDVVSLNMANYLADIKFGSAMYGRSVGKKNFLAFGIQYVDYGAFKYTNETNDLEDGLTFTAKDFALHLIYARQLTKKITLGATLKPVYSAFERYTSFGAAIDAGISYNDAPKLFSAGLVLRNMGTQFKGYYTEEGDQHLESLPFDIQLGLTKKLAHAPLRFSLTLHHLQHWNLNYSSENQATTTLSTTDTDEEDNTVNISTVDMAFRHAIFGVEFVPSKNFYITFGYNHRRHKELSMSGFKSMAGFSGGFGIKLYKFQVGFGMTQYQVGNNAYLFSISTSLNQFRL